MQGIVDVLSVLNAAAAVALTVVGATRIRRGGRARPWGAGAFAALAVVLILAGARPGDAFSGWPGKVLLCFLLTFPYMLLRFAAAFGTLAARFVRPAGAATGVLIVATLVLPSIPSGGAPRPVWLWVYVIAIVVYWTALSWGTVCVLWQKRAEQPRLARRRMRLMAGATVGVNVLILLLGLDVGDIVVESLLLISLAAFALGYAPPSFVRLAWRAPEQERVRLATEELARATTVSDVIDTLLPHVPPVVGGAGAAVYDAEWNVVASTGTVPEVDREAAGEPGDTVEVLPLSPPFGALVVATSPLTPFFGREEVGLLRSLAAIADLSLARCALYERDHASQEALREAVESAERANAAKSDFVSRMSHELRTPLNVVLGFGQLLEMRGSLADRDAEAVAHILKAGNHLLELINEVLDLSRIESGRMTISPEPVEVSELAAEALDLMRPLAEERDVRLIARLGPCHRHVVADRQRLKQVLLNLLANAIKYNRDGGDVRIGCREATNGRLRLEVADTGPGIPAALMDRLFQPFERLAAERGSVEGTGLGLALSRQLVTLMGGEIGVESREGEGSTFWVELECAAAPPTNGAERSVVDVAGRREPAPEHRRVLLVEDNLANVKLIEVLTADREHVELLPAMTGRLGLELAREHQPDLILLDQHLPDVPGVEVLHRLKAHPDTRGIPVVVVSADATAGQIRRMRELGAADYLTKPLDVPRFLRVVDGIIEPDEAQE